jgi:predicted nucleotidyltransferase
MRLHHVLDEVLSSRSHIRIVRTLQDTAQGFTGREIARSSGLTHRTCLQTLTKLEDLSVVQRQRGGRDHIFKLNRKHVIVSEGLLPLLELERKLVVRLEQVLRRHLAKQTTSIILFGSVARGDETVGSDLDVCIVAGDSAQFKKLKDIVHELQTRVKETFGAYLAPIYYTESEFRKQYSRKRSPVVGIVQEGKKISGLSLNSLIHGKEK